MSLFQQYSHLKIHKVALCWEGRFIFHCAWAQPSVCTFVKLVEKSDDVKGKTVGKVFDEWRGKPVVGGNLFDLVEGLVVVLEDGRMVKVKTKAYEEWKCASKAKLAIYDIKRLGVSNKMRSGVVETWVAFSIQGGFRKQV